MNIIGFYRTRNFLLYPRNKDFMNRDLREYAFSELSRACNLYGEFNLKR